MTFHEAEPSEEVEPVRGRWHRARSMLVDITPITQNRNFALLFYAMLVSNLGSQLTVVAIPYQVFVLTRSSFQVGAVSLAQLIPLIIGSLIGGSAGDALDRRLMILGSCAALALTSAALAINAAGHHPNLVAIYLISALASGLGGFSNAARSASVATIVTPEQMTGAQALTQILFQLGSVLGPAASGFLIAGLGLSWVFGLDAITYTLAIIISYKMAAVPPADAGGARKYSSILDGLRYLKGRPALQGVYLVDINAMVFGMPRALFPALALVTFHSGVRSLGYLYAAPGVGALIGAFSSGWVARVKRQGGTVIVAVVVWGAAIATFGLIHILSVALILLAVAGWADVISAVLRNTILQTSISEAYRSRLSSIQMAVVQGGPRLGDLEAGSVAAGVNVGFSVVSGGLACIVGAVILAGLLPGFAHQRSGEHPDPEQAV